MTVLVFTFLVIAPFVLASEAEPTSSLYGFGFLAFLFWWFVAGALFAFAYWLAREAGWRIEPRDSQNNRR